MYLVKSFRNEFSWESFRRYCHSSFRKNWILHFRLGCSVCSTAQANIHQYTNPCNNFQFAYNALHLPSACRLIRRQTFSPSSLWMTFFPLSLARAPFAYSPSTTHFLRAPGPKQAYESRHAREKRGRRYRRGDKSRDNDGSARDFSRFLWYRKTECQTRQIIGILYR